MRAFPRILIASGLTAVVAACSLSSTGLVNGGPIPSGTVAFTRPAGGETYQIGDTVELAWSCPDCANIPSGDYLQVLAYDGVSTYMVDDSAAFTDSTAWVAGSSLQSVSLLAGSYAIVARDVAGFFSAQSGVFQLAGAH